MKFLSPCFYLRKEPNMFIILCILCVFPVIIATFATNTVTAAPEKKVRVGYYITPGFQEYDAKTNLYSGYSYEYLLAIAQYTHWVYEFVPVTFPEGVKLLAAGELDIMNNIAKTPERSAQLDYSLLPSGENCAYLVMPPGDANVSFEDFKAFNHLTVGLVETSYFNDKLLDYCNFHDCLPTLRYYPDTQAIVDALDRKEINAYITTSSQDVDVHIIGKFAPGNFYFATTKGNTELLQELNGAMNSIQTNDPYFQNRLYNKYYDAQKQLTSIFTDEEKAFIAENPIIPVLYHPAWQPLSYREESSIHPNRFSGALSEIYSLIEQKTGFKFKYTAAATAYEASQLLDNGAATLIVEMPYDYIWASKLNVDVTKPFLTLNVVAAFRQDTGNGKTIALPHDSYMGAFCQSTYKDAYSYKYYADAQSCLDAVLQGEADYAYINSYQAEYFQSHSKYRALSFRIVRQMQYGLSIGIAKTADQRLFSILSKTLDSISNEEINYILSDTSLTTKKPDLMNTLYQNPQYALLLFVLLVFIFAILISSFLYTHSIRKKNQQLEKATNAKTQFLSRMSHDMRTPMNAILGLSQLGLEKTSGEAEKSSYFQKIYTSGQYLLSLINDILDVNKIESGKIQLVPTVIYAPQLIEDTIATTRILAEQKKVRFDVDVRQNPPIYLSIDAFHFKQIFMNLLSNAVKFTPPNGVVSFSLETAKLPPYHILYTITVRDTGIGISPEFIKNIYEPFTQESNTIKTEYQGTGLGMTIAKRLVDLFGGTITIESQKGSGTVFTVQLASAIAEAPPQELPKKPLSLSQLQGKRILLCEDHPLNQEIATKVLQKQGCIVDCAGDGAAGLQKFLAAAPHSYDAILMDIRMPKLNGLECAQAIRSSDHPDAKTIPMIAMTANAYDDDKQKSKAAGMNAHLTKPLQPQKLYETLARLL